MDRVQASLGAKLFVAHLLVIVVGVITLLVAAMAFAPALFARHLAELATGPSTVLTPDNPHLTAAFRATMWQALIVAAGVASLAAFLTSLLVARRIVRPIQQMLAATQRIAAGNYAERVPCEPATARDELGRLATSFNTMASALEETERQRRALIGDVAHELRTPIATLEGYLEGLLDGVVEPSAETWARLHGEAGRLRRIVSDLQEVSRAEARQLSLTVRPVAPRTIITAALDRISTRFVEQGLDVEVAADSDLPPVAADYDRAIQVLTNLLTNALRYTPASGQVTVSAEHTGTTVTFRVRDTGIGFTREQATHLFDRFYRVEKSRARALGGTGVGLTIARALVEAMGGDIQADSPGPGHGSVFTFTLPVSR